MKWIKRLAVVILALPIAIASIFVIYEIFGLCVNHIATKIQTDTLQANLESQISDIEIISVYSETGNTSGTGNHVDCLSYIVFSTSMKEDEIKDCISKYYDELDEWHFFVSKTEELDKWNFSVPKAEDGYYIIYVNTSAPFADNIEGH